MSSSQMVVVRRASRSHHRRFRRCPPSPVSARWMTYASTAPGGRQARCRILGSSCAPGGTWNRQSPRHFDGVRAPRPSFREDPPWPLRAPHQDGAEARKRPVLLILAQPRRRSRSHRGSGTGSLTHQRHVPPCLPEISLRSLGQPAMSVCHASPPLRLGKNRTNGTAKPDL